MAADISLLFGVLGEGSLSGNSGKLIQRQLTRIMAKLNKNPLKVKVGIDTNIGGKKSWSSQLQEKLDKVSASGKFSAQISTLKLSSGAVSDFKKQLTAIVNTVGLTTGTEITISAKGIEEIKGKLQETQEEIRKTGTDAGETARKIAEFRVQMEALTSQRNAIRQSLASLGKSGVAEGESSQIAELTARYEQWAVKIEEVRAAKAAVPADQRAAIEAEGAAILTSIKRLSEESVFLTQKNSALKAGITLLTRMEKAERDWTAAQTGRSRSSYSTIQNDIGELKDYKRQLDNDKISIDEFRANLSRLQKSFSENSNTIKDAGENTQALDQRMGSLAGKFSAWLSVSQAIMLAVRSIRNMVSATIELDDAMTQLKIVTRDTDAAYEKYLATISKTATRIGSTIPDLISSTTTYARLGYSLDESSALAEYTAMLQNVGDIDVSDAQDAITAIVKAFGVSIDDIESVMDKLVVTGNNFPISVSQIAEGMNNASSALAAAGNTFDQSVALLTAANTTIQNAAKSSTGLRTIAARLRSTKTELDELGEAMTEAEYGKLVAALTEYNVALTDANGEFRSTYDIVADIAAKWDELSSMEQSALANAISGTRQQAVFFSMVEQFQEASGAMEDMANSAGTLQSSYDTFMESTTAHINQFKAAFQSLAETTVKTDFLNGFIDFGTGLIKTVESVMTLINAFGGLNTVLAVTVGLFATMNADAILGGLRRLASPIRDLTSLISLFSEQYMLAFNASKAESATKMASVLSGLKAGFAGVAESASAAQLAVGGVFAAIAAIAIVVKIYDALTVSAEEATAAMEESFSEFEEATNKVESLNSELETTRARIRELEAKDGLTFVEESELEKLRETNRLLQIQADLAEKAAKAAAEDAADDTVTAYRKNFKHEISADAVQGYIASSSATGNNAILSYDDTNISALLAYVEQMKKLRDEVGATSEDYLHYQGLIDDTTDSIWAQATVLQGYADKLEAIPYDDLTEIQKTALTEINNAIALIYKTLDPAKWKDIQFSGLTDGVKDELNRMSAEGQMTEEQVSNLAQRFPELSTVMEQTGMTASDVADYFNSLTAAQDNSGTSAEVYTAKLSDLSETISGMKSAYDLLDTAQEEMNTAGGLSADTIAKLASSCDNYMDFLYEENGLIKLNTEAWRENAEVKMRSDMAAIRQEIAALEAQNRLLREQMSGVDSSTLPGQVTLDSYNAQLRDNMALIQEHQNQLSLYEGVLNTVKASADSAFQSVSESLNGLIGRYDAMNAAQKEFNESGILSASTLTSIASSYPALQSSIDAYIAGMVSAKDLLEQLSGAYSADVDNYNAAIQAKIASGVGFQNTMTENQSILVKALTEAYQTDLSNFKAVEEKKLEFQAQIIAKLAQNYSKYANASLAGMKAEMDNLLISAGDSAEISALSDAINAIEIYNAQLNKIASGEGLFSSFNAEKFKVPESKSSGSSSSSKASKEEAKGWLDTLSDLDSNVNSLSGALKELNEEGSVSTKTLSGLSGAFGKLSSFNSAINAMGKSGATIGEAQEACNALAEELIRTSGILDMVTEENAEVIASALEAMGVTNARALVLRKFNTTSAAAIVSENGLTNAAWEQVEAFLQSVGVTQEEINALRVLRQEQYNAALAATDFSKANAGVTEALMKQAKAAGASSDQIEALMKIQQLQSMGKAQADAQGYLEGVASFEEALTTLANRAKIEIGDIKVDVPDVNVNVSVSGGEKESSEGSPFSFDGNVDDLSTTVKAWEAAVYRFTEATERLRKSTEAISKAEADINMTDDTREKFAKQLGLVGEYKQNLADMAALSEEVRDEIIKQTEAIAASGIEVIYKPEFDELTFPGYNNKETLDKAVDSVDRERMAFEAMMSSANYAVTETGNKVADSALYFLSDTFSQMTPAIGKLNDLLGTQYTIESFREQQRASGAVTSDADNTFVYALEKVLSGVAANEKEGIRTEATELFGRINGLMRSWKTLADGVDMSVSKVWSAFEDPSSVFAAYRPSGDGGWDDKGKVDFNSWLSEDKAYKQSISNIIDNSIKLNEENQKRNEDMLEAQKKIHELWRTILDTLATVVEESNQSLDNIQNVYSTLKEGAKEFSETGGYLSIDTYQKILDLGPQYMQFLVDENGQWAINEERIQAVTAAKAEQLALDNAWTYVERLKLALQEDAIEKLDELLGTTMEAAHGTWDLVYANLAMLNLNGEQYEAALHNIQVMRDLAYGAIQSIGIMSDTASDSISNMRDGLDDIVNYVMEMLKQKVQDQIDAIGDMKDAYGELIEAKKKSLDATKSEESYEKKRAKQLKEIAKLQAKIDMLSLDNSREAQAEKKKLLEEMSSLQESLSDTQSDYAIDNQKDALDKMKDAYEKEKDAEIKELEDSISSKQKLWEKAIDYIRYYWENNWDALKAELLQWNYDVGNDLEENLVSAWESATAAAQKYGDFVSAMDALKGADGSGDYGNAVANRNEYGSGGNRDQEAGAIVKEMYENSQKWSAANAKGDTDTKKALDDRNMYLGGLLRSECGINAERRDGSWYVGNELLYDKYRKYIYHEGGIAGNQPTLRQNEVMAILEKGEPVLDKRKEEGLYRIIDFVTVLSEKMGKAVASMDMYHLFGNINSMDKRSAELLDNISARQTASVQFGNVYIYGANDETTAKHREINRQFTNDVLKHLNIKH